MNQPKRARSAKLLNDIIEEIAKEENLSVKDVNIFLQSVFGNMAEDFRKGNFKGTSILNLGRFIIKPYRLQKHLEKLQEQKTDGNNIENKG